MDLYARSRGGTHNRHTDVSVNTRFLGMQQLPHGMAVIFHNRM
jgi:hypothetical protein